MWNAAFAVAFVRGSFHRSAVNRRIAVGQGMRHQCRLLAESRSTFHVSQVAGKATDMSRGVAAQHSLLRSPLGMTQVEAPLLHHLALAAPDELHPPRARREFNRRLRPIANRHRRHRLAIDLDIELIDTLRLHRQRPR